MMKVIKGLENLWVMERPLSRRRHYDLHGALYPFFMVFDGFSELF
jgi:hypothetical protein